MASLPDKDDKLVARGRRSIRTEGRVAWSLLVAIFIVSALFVGVTEFHMPAEETGIAAFAVLLVWVAMVFRYKNAVPSAVGHYDEEILQRTIDDQHRRWRWLYTFIFIAVGGFAFAVYVAQTWPMAAHSSSHVSPLVTVLAVDLAIAAVVAVFQICFGPAFLAGAYRRALNDELTRAMQRSAAIFGYALSVMAMCSALGVAVIHPQWGFAAMPGAIAAAVILPGLYFLIQQWRAERDV